MIFSGRTGQGGPVLARAVFALVLGVATAQAAASGVAVTFIDSSKPTRCAEEDNIYVQLLADGIHTLTLSAEHPPYIAAVTTDSTAPDFTHCDMSADPRFDFTPRTLTLFEDARIRLVGHTFTSFWRPELVTVKVGGRTESGLHLLQLLRKESRADIEILVVYPADGYWRAKPLPPPQLSDSAYGSSFLFGPIDEDQRPYVAFSAIEFHPDTLRFDLRYRDGSSGALQVVEASPTRTRVRLSMERGSRGDRPFAALRSMFVTADNADASVAGWQDPQGKRRTEPLLGFGRFEAAAARFGRDHPSRHNLSAPDHVFGDFSRTPWSR